MNVKEKVLDVLNSDATLVSLLTSAPWGGPAIYETWAPEHDRPYITVKAFYGEGIASAYLRTGFFEIDCWDNGNSYVKLEQMKDRVIQLLDRQLFSTDESGPSFRLFLGMDAEVQDPDPDILRWRVEFNIRFWRQSFIEG